MSNPAVIKLSDASSRRGKFKRFVLEDNIGESIHLHIDNMRVDFTIQEFLDFSEMIRCSLNEIGFLGRYSIGDFDEFFLKECSPFLLNLKSIEVEEVVLSELQCIVNKEYKYSLNIKKILPISSVPAYKYLKGDRTEFISYKQFNYCGIDNEKRLLELLESIEKNGYPYQSKYIIIFNDQNIIRDGQHRAAILAHLYGLKYKVKVMRFCFSGESHYITNKKNNILALLKWFLKYIYRIIK